MPVTENVALGTVLHANSHATNSFHAKTTNVLRDVIHQLVTLVIKQKRSLVFVVTLDSWFLVGWNE